jgi:triphosphoribosyl-dephospho-CoA synthase
MLHLGLCAQLACIWEATARKGGNVHRYADFADLTYLDFILSAAAIAPVLANAPRQRVGATILDGIRATRRVVGTNTNLGILLLIAPLATVPQDEPLRPGVRRILANLDIDDARDVYAAIRLAVPGGLGDAAEQDVRTEPTVTLLDAMRLAADRDLVARQYAVDYADVFDVGVPAIQHGLTESGALEPAIVRCHLELMAERPDSLIARKCGREVADESARRARDVLAHVSSFDDFDGWLRADGHQRNPGATADLVAATMFVLLREGLLSDPLTVRWSN